MQCKTASVLVRLSSIPTLILLTVSMTAVALTGCGGGGGGDDPDTSGEVVIGLTDAPGDFLSYTVDVLSVKLTRANGAVVETLPLSTRVDFAQYTEVTEFLTAATVPVGTYTSATLRLDYSDADIWVEDASGDAVQVAATDILDEDGDPVSVIDVSVEFDPANRIVIAVGVPAHLTLDFDLESSNQVEFTGLVPSVTVQPVLVAEVNRETVKIHRLRGPLKSVNPDDDTFRVIIRPFVHLIAGGDERFGTLQVVTDAATIFEINGVTFTGSAGIDELDTQPDLSAIIVLGDLNVADRRFEAEHVYVGSSVPGGALDVVSGNVTARTGNQLTVKGATLVRAAGSVIFRNEVTVDLGLATSVTRQLSLASFGLNDISVGQRVAIFGELDGTETNLDADVAGGHVHLLLSTVRGTIVQASPLVVDVQAIDGRPVTLFDFDGTGVDLASDADPDNYEIDTATLSLAGLTPGDPIKVRGFVTEFGHSAVTEDFDASTVIDIADVPGLFTVTWFPATPTAIPSSTASAIDLDLTGTGLFHHMNRAGHIVDLTSLSDPQIVPNGDNNGVFSIVNIGGTIQLFFSFDAFAIELDERLDAGASVRSVFGIGRFDDATATLTGDWVSVRLHN